MEDDCVCDYDSTWDTESDGDDPAGESKTRRSNLDKNKPSWALWHHTPRNMRAAKDMQNYRRGYPNLTDDECTEDKMNNLQFYLNKFPSAPDDIYIESFHKDWKNDYKRLERVHSYIQWLFPLREPGVNYMASELTKKEIEAFKKNEDAKGRLVESYELMLGFYGIRLVNKETGEVKRAENWKDRFGNLERNMHNNLRITRILKSLGELGFEHYQAPLVRFFLEETLVKKTLSGVKRSVLDYFLFAVLDRQKRQELVKFAYLHFEPKDKFVWCPRKVQKQFRKAEKSKDGDAALQHKEEGLDNNTKAQKGNDKNKSKPPAEPARPQAEDEPVRNGNVEPESNVEVVRNGNVSPDDDQEMDQSRSPDTTTRPEPDEQKFTSNSTAAVQEAEVMQTDGDVQTENPPKKKREEDEALTDHLAEHSASGQVRVGGAADKTTGHLSPSVHTPHKTSKHSPSPSSEREEKIPRTDFSPQPHPEEASEEEVSGTNGVEDNRGVDELENRTESDDEMESSSEQNQTNS